MNWKDKLNAMDKAQLNILKSRDSMKYQDPYFDQKPKVFDFSPPCPVCKHRLYYPGFMHVWMVVKRSDVLDVQENHLHPILMHKECAIRYEVTKRLLISAGTIKPDPVEILSIWDSMSSIMEAGMLNIQDYQSQYETFPLTATAQNDKLDAIALNFGKMQSRLIDSMKIKNHVALINEEQKP